MTEHSTGNLGGVPTLIVATLGMHGLCGLLLQSAHEENKPAEITDYENPTLAEFMAVHNQAYEFYLVVSMILFLDLSIYGKLIKDLSKSYLMRTY